MKEIRWKLEEHIDEFLSWTKEFKEIDEDEIKEFRQIVTEIKGVINTTTSSEEYNILMDIIRTLLVIAHRTVSLRLGRISNIAMSEVILKDVRDEERASLMEWEKKYIDELKVIFKQYIDEFMGRLGFR